MSTVVSNSTAATIPIGPPSRRILFFFLIILAIPSVICSLFVFYKFVQSRQLRSVPKNRIFIGLLVINFIEVMIDFPLRLYFLYNSVVPFPVPMICQLWRTFEYVITGVNLFMMVVASIQRHLLIFHPVFLNHHQFVLFSLPLSLCILLPIVWYPANIFGTPCVQKYNYERHICGSPCYITYSPYVGFFNTVLLTGVPVASITLANILLVIRVIVKKQSMKQSHIWRKNIRMAAQLLSIAALYLTIWVPLFVMWCISSFSHESNILAASAYLNSEYFAHLKYIVILFVPFFTLFGQPKMYSDALRNFFQWVMPTGHRQASAMAMISRPKNRVTAII